MLLFGLFPYFSSVCERRAFRPDIILLSAGFDAAAKVRTPLAPHVTHET